jgi:molecular chaperone Hsp33
MQTDTLHRFLIESANVRGEWIHLDDTWQSLLDCAAYPASIKKVLGEALAATLLLSATLKYQGSLSLQINGTGAVSLLLIQATSEGTVRGLARWKHEPEEDDLATLFGDANLVITIEPNDGTKRYQGIVALQTESLAASLAEYFQQSEQLATRLWLATGEHSVAGLLLQRLPNRNGDDEAENEEGWQRSVQLTDTVRQDELLTLKTETLLHRLFHEEDVRLFTPNALSFQCSCSPEKVEAMVVSLGQEETDALLQEQGEIAINCEFCNRRYQLDAIDVQQLFSDSISNSSVTAPEKAVH